MNTRINGVLLEVTDHITPKNDNFVHDFRVLEENETDRTLTEKLVGKSYRGFTIVAVQFMAPGKQFRKIIGLEVTKP